MPIKSGWYDETKTIILHEFTGTWSWQNLFDAIVISKDLLDTVNHKVCVILDLRTTSSMPSMNMRAMQQLANSATSNHPNMTVRYIVGLRPYLKTMFEMFGRLFPRAYMKYRAANTLEDAFANIRATNILEAPRV